MKYKKSEAKEYAKSILKGVWTALPYNFTEEDRLDEAGIAYNLEYCISDLNLAGHYCSGNVAEFWSLTNQERMRGHEINVEVAKGRIPLIAGCHHQNPYEVVAMAQHAEAIGIDFVIILTPYMAARSDDAVYDFYKFIADRVNIGIVLFNIPAAYHPISEHLAKRLATIPNICGFKQGGPSPASAIAIREAIGKDVVVSIADEAPWLNNIAVMGDRWLLNYCPHLYQVPGWTPINDYTAAALAGDFDTAVAISREVNGVRAAHAKWISDYGRAQGRMPVHEQKYWMEIIGMVGGSVRVPSAEMSEENKLQMRRDLEAAGIVGKIKKASR